MTFGNIHTQEWSIPTHSCLKFYCDIMEASLTAKIIENHF